jgi:aryl-alcohol dehydrogenase-like predicted oxidoreductase
MEQRRLGTTGVTVRVINWGVRDPRVTVSIPATRSVEHADDNCRVGEARRFDSAARERVAAPAARL